MFMNPRLQRITHPPVARRAPVAFEQFGVRWTDDYAWLRDPSWPDVGDPEILAHLAAENAWFEAVMEPRRALIEDLHGEMRARLRADDASVPAREGEFEYWWRYPPEREYRVWLRRSQAGGEPTVILDENELAQDRSYFALRSLAASPDGRLLAYATDEDGSERFALHLENLITGERLADLVTNTGGTMVWGEDGETLLYVELDAHLRPWRVRAHRVGSDPAEDSILFVEADPAFFVSIGKTLDRALLLIVSGTHESRETWIVDAGHPTEPPRLVARRRPGHRYSVDHAHGRLWIRTDDVHPNFRLVSTPTAAPDEASWQEEVPPRDDVYLVEHACFADFAVLRERCQGLAGMRLRDWSGREHAIDFGEPAGAPFIGDNREFETDRVRISFSSLVTPPTVFDYLVAERRLITRKVQSIPSGYDPASYVAETLYATAGDGTAVPISLLRRRDQAPDAPLFLYGYGSYGHGLDTSFLHLRLSLVDRGFTYALAHVRGGDEKGPRWWSDGRLQAKNNTFDDFIACAETLVAKGRARAGEIAIKGTSAGGMLIGVVVNRRPELWRCAIAEVPFVDVLHTMLDKTLLLTPIEWPEWGNPLLDEAAFQTIRAYSPYDNVRAQPYPHLLVTAGVSDPRVGYWEPAKWVARLRACKTDDHELLLKVHTDAGHFGRSGRYESLRDLAEQYAFVLASFGLA
jgi:oligopeptidase B